MVAFSANLSMLWTDVPFLDRFGRARAAGFTTVEYLFPYDHDTSALRAALDAHALRQDLFNLPAGDFAAGERGMAVDPARVEEFRRGVETALEVAEVLDPPKLNCLVGRRPAGVADAEMEACLVENLRWAAERVGAAGRRLVIEPLNPVDAPGFALTSFAVARRIVEAVGSPHLGLQVDLYHLQRIQGEVIPTLRALAPIIGHVQVADPPRRGQPGTGELNYGTILAVLDEIGYAGRIGLEYAPIGDTDASLGWIEALGYRRD